MQLYSYFLALNFDAHICFPCGSLEQKDGCIGSILLFCLQKELCDNILASGKHWLIVYLNSFFKFRQKGALFNHKGIHIAFIVQYKLSRIICHTETHVSIVNRNCLDLLLRGWKVSDNKHPYKYHNQLLMFKMFKVLLNSLALFPLLLESSHQANVPQNLSPT